MPHLERQLARLIRTVLPLCLLPWVCGPAAAQTFASTESRFLDGLRERRLFELAESHCRRQLAEAYAGKRRKAEATIELSRTLLEAALYSQPPQRDERFAAALKVLDDLRFDAADEPWRTPLAVQRGVAELVWGELLREEAQTLSAPESALAPAREHLAKAAATLRQACSEIDRQLQAASRPAAAAPKPDELSAAEWTALKRNVDYQLARAYRNQGETYPPRSADRTTSFDQALEMLEHLARSETTDALTWQARLDEAVCRRLLGDLDGAERMLVLIDEQKPPANVADRARAQRIRVRLNAALPDEAQKFVRETDADPAEAADPDVRLAVLEWMLATARVAAQANKPAEVEARQQLAAAMTKLIAERHSAYWARRAESLMAAAVASSPVGDAALLVKAAESMYQQGNADRAVELYDQATEKADAAKQTDVAFSAAFTAAAIEQQRGRFAAAAERFLKLAATQPTHRRAAEAHLAGIFNTAQLLAKAPDRAAAEAGYARYAELLQHQIRQWPTAPSTTQAHLWLGRLRQLQADWPAAIAAYAGVPVGDAQADEALRGLTAAWSRRFEVERAQGKPLDLAEMERQFAAYAPGLPEMLPATSTPTARLAARTLAQMYLEFADDRAPRAAALLTQLAAAPDLPADEALAIETLRVLVDVESGRYDEAALRIGKLTSVSPNESAAVAAKLNRLAGQRPDVQAKIAPIVLRVLELRRLHDRQLAPTAGEAESLAAAGRTTEAKRLWEQLTQQSPRDGELQEAYARFLAGQSDPASRQTALAKWREVEKLSTESSPRWFRARLALARLYLQGGEKTRAAQIIELTAALHPELGGAALKAEFEQTAAAAAKP